MIGQSVAHYRVTSKLGAGGMGEVFRATDSKLNRDVALKLLPSHLSGDKDRMARFHREAQVLASLNHPHIAGIHGIEESGTQTALVMELVEGEDLSERLRHGPIPMIEALKIARQVAALLHLFLLQGIRDQELFADVTAQVAALRLRFRRCQRHTRCKRQQGQGSDASHSAGTSAEGGSSAAGSPDTPPLKASITLCSLSLRSSRAMEISSTSG